MKEQNMKINKEILIKQGYFSISCMGEFTEEKKSLIEELMDRTINEADRIMND